MGRYPKRNSHAFIAPFGIKYLSSSEKKGNPHYYNKICLFTKKRKEKNMLNKKLYRFTWLCCICLWICWNSISEWLRDLLIRIYDSGRRWITKKNCLKNFFLLFWIIFKLYAWMKMIENHFHYRTLINVSLSPFL